MQQPQTPKEVLEIYAPDTARFIEERKLNAERVLQFIFNWLYYSPNIKNLPKALSSSKVRINLFPRLFAYYCGVGGLLWSFFFTFFTKKISLHENLYYFLNGLMFGCTWFTITKKSYEEDFIQAIKQDFQALNATQLRVFLTVARNFIKEYSA